MSPSRQLNLRDLHAELRKQLGKSAYIRHMRDRLLDQRAISKVQKALSDFPKPIAPDLILCHDVFPHRCADFFRSQFACPLIVDISEIPSLNERTGSYYRTAPETYKKTADRHFSKLLQTATAIITQSPGYDQWLRSNHGLGAKVIRNARRLSEIETISKVDLRTKLEVPSNTRILVMHNLAAKLYGLEHGICALRHLPDHWHFLFIGPYSSEGYERELLAFSASKNLSHRVHFLPPIWDEGMLSHLADCDLGLIAFELVSDTIRLSLPNRFFDLVAAGLPVVSANIPPLSELIKEQKLGVAIDPVTPESIAHGVKTLEPSLAGRYGPNDPVDMKLIKEQRARFNWEHETGALISLIMSLLENKKSSQNQILIICDKNFKRNNRIQRIKSTCLELGFGVGIIWRSHPFDPYQFEWFER